MLENNNTGLIEPWIYLQHWGKEVEGSLYWTFHCLAAAAAAAAAVAAGVVDPPEQLLEFYSARVVLKHGQPQEIALAMAWVFSWCRLQITTLSHVLLEKNRYTYRILLDRIFLSETRTTWSGRFLDSGIQKFDVYFVFLFRNFFSV